MLLGDPALMEVSSFAVDNVPYIGGPWSELFGVKTVGMNRSVIWHLALSALITNVLQAHLPIKEYVGTASKYNKILKVKFSFHQ
jgi:hypothetical protein